MKKLLLMAGIFICSQSGFTATLDGVTATSATEVNAPKSVWTSTGVAAAYTVPTGGADVLVFATFSTKTPDDLTPQARTGEWRLNDGSTTSLPIQRSLSKGGDDSGVASVVNIFSCASGLKSFNLDHQTVNTVGNKLAQTYNMSLVALPLKTSDSIALAKAQDTTDSYEFQTTSSSLVTVEKAASTELAASLTMSSAAGKVLVISSYNSASAEATIVDKLGTWEIHIRKSGETITTKVGETMLRSMHLGASVDIGACTITGIADSWNGAPLEAGTTYEVLLKTKTTAGTLVTKNVTLTAVSLSYMESGTPDTPYTFPARQSTISTATTTTSVNWQDSGLAFTHTMPSTAKMFLASSYICSSGPTLPGDPREGDFRLADNNGTPFTSMPVRRQFSGSDDFGSAGNVGLTPSYSLGSKTCKLQYQPVDIGYDITLDSPVLVSVVLTSESYPSTQASDIIFDAVGETDITLSWINGDGLARLVVCKEGLAPSSSPLDATTYSASSTFGIGDALGGGYVVYAGPDDSVSVDGLMPNINYYFQVYEYNYGGTETKYKNTTSGSNPDSQKTIPEPSTMMVLIMAGALLIRKLK